MLVISSRISGWRVTASITLPKMIPMPTPAPTAPRPPPTADPEPAVRSPEDGRATRRMVEALELELLVVLVVVDRAAEVDGGQGGEDERLQRGDQAQLEQVDGDPERQREPAEAAASPRITASPPAMNRMIMWPARMLANSRTSARSAA